MKYESEDTYGEPFHFALKSPLLVNVYHFNDSVLTIQESCAVLI